jgi:hypothetical protein
MVPRLRQGAEPEPIDATLKTLKAKWPRLAARAETDSATPKVSAVNSEVGREGLKSRAASSESGSQEEKTRTVEPQTRAAEPETKQEKPQIQQQKPLSERLFSLFGGGDNPSLRRALYIRVQLTCQTFGKPAEVVLREVCEAARRARSPGNYFAFSIVRRFREHGFIEEV